MNRNKKEQLITGKTKKCLDTECNYGVPSFWMTQEKNQKDILHWSTDALVTSAVTWNRKHWLPLLDSSKKWKLGSKLVSIDLKTDISRISLVQSKPNNREKIPNDQNSNKTQEDFLYPSI